MMSKSKLQAVVLIVVLGSAISLLPAPASVLAAFDEAKLTASDGAAGDRFGFSVGISGDSAVVVVGAYRDDDNGLSSGSAYVHRYNGVEWIEAPKLSASDAAKGDFFGYSVSASGDVVVIGAHGDDDGGPESGSAYVYRYNGVEWIEAPKLSPSDAAAGDFFGYSVSVSGAVVVIGAYRDDDGGPESGSAYIFRYNGVEWIQTAHLSASDSAAGDYFGRSVSVSGDVVVIGAHGDDDGGPESGSAYVYRYNGVEWIEAPKLSASDAAAGDYFGSSVSVSGDVAVIGAYGDDDGGPESGSGYVFRYNGAEWIQTAHLSASDSAAGDYFGRSVSVSGDVVVIGAYGDDDGGPESGSGYVFRYNGAEWIQTAKLSASDAAADDYFGRSVSVSGDVVVIGAYGDDDGGSESGSAYVLAEYSSAVPEDGPKTLRDFVVHNYPNPFNPVTTIEYSIASDSHVNLAIYDVNGRVVRTLVDGFEKKDTYGVIWNGRNDRGNSVASGTYYCRMETKHFSQTKKLILMK